MNLVQALIYDLKKLEGVGGCLTATIKMGADSNGNGGIELCFPLPASHIGIHPENHDTYGIEIETGHDVDLFENEVKFEASFFCDGSIEFKEGGAIQKSTLTAFVDDQYIIETREPEAIVTLSFNRNEVEKIPKVVYAYDGETKEKVESYT